MTNVSQALAKQWIAEAVANMKADLAIALGRIKSLEDKSGDLEKALEKIKSLETKSSELIKQIEELKGASQELKESNEVLKVSNAGQKTSAQIWEDMAKDVSVKNGISNIITVEANNSKQKEKNLIIMEKRDNAPKKLADGKELEIVKLEMEKVLVAIGEDDCKNKVRATRFNNDGPILVVCDNRETKLKILKAANKLRDNGYSGVFINNDRTVAEAAIEKKLREEAKVKNMALEHGSGYLKYGQQTINGKNFKWYWGVRGMELRKIYKPEEGERTA